MLKLASTLLGQENVYLLFILINKEIYYVISGSGKAIIDNEEVNLVTGDWVRISPVAERQFFANKNNAISYICIQVKENSLEGFTANDAIIK